MPDVTPILSAIRNDLRTAGLVRRPQDAGTLPPMHLEPRTGPPAPGDRTDGASGETSGALVVTARLSSTLPESIGDGYRVRHIIDLVYRSKGQAAMQQGRALDSAIVRRLLAEHGEGRTLPDPRSGKPPVFLLSVSVFGGLGPVGMNAAGVWTDVSKLAVETLR